LIAIGTPARAVASTGRRLRTLLPPLPAQAWLLMSLFMAGLIWVGWAASGDLTLPVETDRGNTHRPWGMVWTIFAQNTGAALLLFSGVVTAGLGTVSSVVVLGIYIGTVIRGSVNVIGAGDAAAILVPYFTLEFTGILIAAVCGIAPVVQAIRWWRQSEKRPTLKATVVVYLDGAGRALRWMIFAVLLLIVAAWLEVLGGIPR
jgi:uncharacterized membrane protein SpoIIM required for sporulation